MSSPLILYMVEIKTKSNTNILQKTNKRKICPVDGLAVFKLDECCQGCKSTPSICSSPQESANLHKRLFEMFTIYTSCGEDEFLVLRAKNHLKQCKTCQEKYGNPKGLIREWGIGFKLMKGREN